jgi:hypothetical protein
MAKKNRSIPALIFGITILAGSTLIEAAQTPGTWVNVTPAPAVGASFFNAMAIDRSEERRVGKEC